MNDQHKIVVREIKSYDIPSLIDYWMNSSDEHLIGMGVDLKKMPERDELTRMLSEGITKPYREKTSFAMILEVDGKATGHCNVNQIVFGKEAKMHLHLWPSGQRRKGLGTQMVLKSLPYFFNLLELQVLYCEPYALNPAPNKTLRRIGFEFVKRHRTIPGYLNFEQEVNLYKLTREKFENL